MGMRTPLNVARQWLAARCATTRSTACLPSKVLLAGSLMRGNVDISSVATINCIALPMVGESDMVWSSFVPAVK